MVTARGTGVGTLFIVGAEQPVTSEAETITAARKPF